MVQSINNDKTKDYERLIKQLIALSEDETDPIAITANASALLNQFLTNINWVGFYLWKEDDNELVLGPFQGRPACIRIPYGKGVCGVALKERTVKRVADVSQFEGHIACDSASRSEIVIPIILNNQPYGVLDIDSPYVDRFDPIDERYLAKYAETIQTFLN